MNQRYTVFSLITEQESQDTRITLDVLLKLCEGSRTSIVRYSDPRFYYEHINQEFSFTALKLWRVKCKSLIDDYGNEQGVLQLPTIAETKTAIEILEKLGTVVKINDDETTEGH